MREPGFDVEALKRFYAERPADFINDWGCTVDPRMADIGLPTVMPFLLFPRQVELVDWMLERWRAREDGLVEKSRDFGASWVFCGFAVWCLVFQPGTAVGMGSRKEEYVDQAGDPKSLFFKIREFIKLLPKEFKPKGYEEGRHAAHMRVINPENGATITGEAGTNIGRGGRSSWYLLDEAAFIEHADEVEAALSQNTNCRFYVSTPNGSGNVFYRKRHGGRIKVFVCDWKDDPRKDKTWYQTQLDKLDAVVVAQEIDRDYSASVTNAWIPGTLVTSAQSRGPADVHAIGPVMVGVDPARFGDDKTVITFRQGRVTFPQVVFGKADVVDVAGRVKDAVRTWREPVAQIAVDTIGIGSGVADILRRDFGAIVVDVNSALRLDDGQNYNLRARMWRDMKEWVKAGASLPTDPDLTVDLTALQYSYRGGLLLMESKDDAKKRGMKSPDRADSIALTFAVPPKEPERPLPPTGSWDVLDEYTGY
jgi:phage terminase large subunit